MGTLIFISYVISFLSFYIYRYKLEQREYYSEPWQKHKLPMYLYILVFIGCLIPLVNFFISVLVWAYILESNIRIKPNKLKNFLTKEL